MKVWIVMSTFDSPVAIAIPTPKAVFKNKKQAQKYCDEHNNNTLTRTELYIRSAEFIEECRR